MQRYKVKKNDNSGRTLKLPGIFLQSTHFNLI